MLNSLLNGANYEKRLDERSCLNLHFEGCVRQDRWTQVLPGYLFDHACAPAAGLGAVGVNLGCLAASFRLLAGLQQCSSFCGASSSDCLTRVRVSYWPEGG